MGARMGRQRGYQLICQSNPEVWRKDRRNCPGFFYTLGVGYVKLLLCGSGPDDVDNWTLRGLCMGARLMRRDPGKMDVMSHE